MLLPGRPPPYSGGESDPTPPRERDSPASLSQRNLDTDSLYREQMERPRSRGPVIRKRISVNGRGYYTAFQVEQLRHRNLEAEVVNARNIHELQAKLGNSKYGDKTAQA